ncbi:MAG TPA: ATP-binding protein [Pseudobdellovibrionaceae bacterium]|nr:ATP-binding protein [Pseudobdellovibrionaceae bacterium]
MSKKQDFLDYPLDRPVERELSSRGVISVIGQVAATSVFLYYVKKENEVITWLFLFSYLLNLIRLTWVLSWEYFIDLDKLWIWVYTILIFITGGLYGGVVIKSSLDNGLMSLTTLTTLLLTAAIAGSGILAYAASRQVLVAHITSSLVPTCFLYLFLMGDRADADGFRAIGGAIIVFICYIILQGFELHRKIMALHERGLEIRRLVEQQVVAAKMVSLGEMAGGIAHEINTPLTTIKESLGHITEAADRPTISKLEIKNSVGRIEKTVERAFKIVRGLRALSLGGTGEEFQRVSLKVLVQDTVDMCLGRFEKKGIGLKVIDFEDMTVEVKPTQISQCLLNLLFNAYDAILNSENRWITIDAVRAGGFIKITVTDSGPGIRDQAILDKMMEPFFTTKGRTTGTGLGLSITRSIVNDHHGSFYYNPMSQNTQFVIEIPLFQANG